MKKSILAALLIGLGNYVLLKLGNPLGPFLFSFGLLEVCILGANLFTGKCGFLFEDKIKILDLLKILALNLIFGYIIGWLFSIADPSISDIALYKIVLWNFNLSFFIKSILCGMIMYLAAKTYKEGKLVGILLGVPLFIFCGFQHCIANIITLGVAHTFNWTIILCIIGNFLGSLLISYLLTNKKENL